MRTLRSAFGWAHQQGLLAADTGARRGELDTLHRSDLHGRLLHIERGVSDEIVTTTKTGRSRRVTVGTHVHDDS